MVNIDGSRLTKVRDTMKGNMTVMTQINELDTEEPEDIVDEPPMDEDAQILMYQGYDAFVIHCARRMTRPEMYPEQEELMDLKIPEKIINIFEFNDMPTIYLVKWQTEDSSQYIAAPVCFKKCPQLVVEFKKNYTPKQ